MHGQLYCGHCGAPVASLCSNCHSLVYPGSRLCGNCGIELRWNQGEPATDAARCPNCSVALAQHSDFCGNCGIKLDWHREQAAKAGLVKRPAGNKAGKIIGGFAIAVLAVIVGSLAFIYLSPDYHMYMVRSESMVPAINMGDIVVTGPVGNPLNSTIKPGTVVTYALGDNLITHRVQSIKGDILITKGDAVENPDPRPVAMSQVRGITLFKIPWLGFVSNFARTKLGWFLVIIIPAIILLGFIIWGIVKELLKRRRRSPQEAVTYT